MEAPDSPSLQHVVGGVLTRGEDTDGEHSDVEVDYPQESFVSKHDGPAAEDAGAEPSADDNAAEFEVTGEGTAGGPFGLKKVLFVRKREDSSKTLGSTGGDQKLQDKPQETFKERVSKLGTGVTERFAALGSIMQDHGTKAGGGILSKIEKHSAVDTSSSQHSDNTSQPSLPSATVTENAVIGGPKRSLEFFQEYEMTFASKPEFLVVPGPKGKGAVVAWPEKQVPTVTGVDGSVVKDGPMNVPPAGAVILAVGRESVVDAESEHVQVLLSSGPQREGDSPKTDAEEVPSAEQEGGESPPTPVEGAEDAPFSLVVRFREKTGPAQDGAGAGVAPGGEFFRKAGKAMATGFGSLFQGKDVGGSAVRDGVDLGASSTSSLDGRTHADPAAAAPSDVFVLTFAAQDGTAAGLPFSMAEMIGGRGVVVSAVTEDYVSALVEPTEPGVSAAGTAAAMGDEGPKMDPDGKVEVLTPGAVLLRVAGQNVEDKSLLVVEKILEATAVEHLAVKILFRATPPIYRASVATELIEECAKTPYVHVGTWQPLLKRRAGVTLGGGDGDNGSGSVIGIGYGSEEWEDVRETMARAHQFVNGFRSAGIRVDVINMHTITLPRNVKSAYAGTFEGRPSSLQQAVRLLFSFPDEKTVSVQKDASSRIMGLTPVETRGGGVAASWISVTAVEGSSCAKAGMPVGENSILTHVNGFDVSPAAYRSLAPAPFGGGEGWGAAVLPAVEGGERGDCITITFV